MKTLVVFMTVLLYSVTLSSQERITLLFVGDLMQHQAQIDAAHVSEGKYDYSSCFSLIKEQISQADLAIGNLEVTLGGKPYRGYPMFSAPDEYLQAIKDAGFDILLTANNHCLDRGKRGWSVPYNCSTPPVFVTQAPTRICRSAGNAIPCSSTETAFALPYSTILTAPMVSRLPLPIS